MKCPHCHHPLTRGSVQCAECKAKVGLRSQVFEIIIRQARAGTDWRKIYAGSMLTNKISAEEIEAELKKDSSEKSAITASIPRPPRLFECLREKVSAS